MAVDRSIHDIRVGDWLMLTVWNMDSIFYVMLAFAQTDNVQCFTGLFAATDGPFFQIQGSMDIFFSM